MGKAQDRHCAKDIRMFGLRGWLEKIWQDGMAHFCRFQKHRERVICFGDAADVFLGFVRNGIVYGYLIVMAINGQMTAAEFLLYLGAAGESVPGWRGTLTVFDGLHRLSGELSLVREYLEWKEPFAFQEGKALSKELPACEICLENVSYRYPEARKDTISHMNLTLHQGEKLAIVGLKRSRKNDARKADMRISRPDRGQSFAEWTGYPAV